MRESKRNTLIDIVIVNLNTGNQLKDCIVSISEALTKGVIAANVVVIDNASVDNSISKLGELFPDIITIRNSENKGFGAACNQGAKCCHSKYILFLNPDTTITSGSLSVPSGFMENPTNADYAACGIQMMNETGKVSKSCDRVPGLRHFIVDTLGLSKIFLKIPLGLHMSEWDHLESRDVDHVIGAFYFIRRSVFEKLGGFDERFFVYWEDMDLSKRIKNDRLKIRYIADAQCFHKGGGTSEKVKAFRLFYFLKSKILYGFKHLNLASAIILLLATYLIEPFTRVIFAIFSGSFSQIRDIARAFILLYTATPGIIKLMRQKS